MAYVDGFVIPVPRKNLQAYRKQAATAGRVWKKYGALDYKECIGDDLDHKDKFWPFPKAVKAKPDETVVFSYIVYKSRAHRDQVNKKVMSDPKILAGMKEPMPFDAKRMAYGGFKVIVDL